jgi:fumarate reductase subunit D|tara:strand:+ start:781 stop:1128 length:348 start_codon:yes stop_codon:yes gene_type:complete
MNAPVRTRNHPSYWAFIVHRVSGIGLACFLPIHLYVISLAIDGEAHLDGFLKWAETLPVKIAETGLVVLLAAHMAGGLRLLAIEFLPWRDSQKTFISIAAGIALVFGLMFFLRAI